MLLPEEILLQILSTAIPGSITHLNSLAEGYTPSETAYRNAEYDRYARNTLVSRRFHSIATEAFFRNYTHDVGLVYGEPVDHGRVERSDISTLQPRRAEIERLRLRVQGSWRQGSEVAVRDLPRLLGTYPGLRELEMFVERLEHSSRVADLEALLWEKVEAWRQELAAGKRMKLWVHFECHDRRVTWDGLGERRIVNLGGPRT